MLLVTIEVPNSWKYLSEAASNLEFMCLNKFVSNQNETEEVDILVTLQTCIWDMHGSNFGQDAAYPD